EDGIRDGHVTGVQTCALPIFARAIAWLLKALDWPARSPSGANMAALSADSAAPADMSPRWMRSALSPPSAHARASDGGPSRSRRSEERRVGKEWRAVRASRHG